MGIVGIETHNQQRIHKCILMVGCKYYRTIRDVLVPLNDNFSKINVKTGPDVNTEK